MTIGEAIQNALDFIEASHGHTCGDVYEDLEAALRIVKTSGASDTALPLYQMQPEYNTMKDFEKALAKLDLVADRSVKEVLNAAGDLVGDYWVRQSGIVCYHALEF
jgi:hypothetical protein